MPRLPTSRPLRVGAFLALQAALWIAIALAFATLIEMAGWAPWTEALVFSATNWLPWVVFAPIVFWLARRFPFERGHLLRAIPTHLVACIVCSFALLWVSAYFAPWPRGRPPYRDGRMTFRELPARPPGEAGTASGREVREPRDFREFREVREAREAQAGEVRESREARELRDPREGREARDPREGRPKGMVGGSGFGRPPGTPGPMGERLFGRFWPPFSSIVLRANVSAAVYLIIACFAHAFAYYRRAQEREHEATRLAEGLSRAKLDALRLQLQPHFLFNTLNAISTLVHRDAHAADELIGDLSELLRLSLQTVDHEVPLSRELELLDCYLAIERARLGERLRIVREIDPAVAAALVPTFVLQPLAENAIRHGIEPRRAPGTLTVRADLIGGNVRLVVADDGVGLKPTGGATARRGIGIANTEQRLRALHGEAAHLDIVSPETGGVQVQIVLPFRTVPAAAKEAEPA